MKSQDEPLGFAPEIDASIPYIGRLRDYYAGLGYGAPYRWAALRGALGDQDIERAIDHRVRFSRRNTENDPIELAAGDRASRREQQLVQDLIDQAPVVMGHGRRFLRPAAAPGSCRSRAGRALLVS
jgi:hypothetical protein